MKKIISITLTLLTFVGCKPVDDIGLLKITNRSGKSILIAYSKLYPDTTAYLDSLYIVCRIDLPDTTCDAYDKGWRGRFNQNPRQTLIFFIYEFEMPFTNPSKRIIINLDSMERANWKLYVY